MLAWFNKLHISVVKVCYFRSGSTLGLSSLPFLLRSRYSSFVLFPVKCYSYIVAFPVKCYSYICCVSYQMLLMRCRVPRQILLIRRRVSRQIQLRRVSGSTLVCPVAVCDSLTRQKLSKPNPFDVAQAVVQKFYFDDSDGKCNHCL